MTVIVSAPGYRRRQVSCATSPAPGKVVAITLVPAGTGGSKVMLVKGIAAHVEAETYLELDANGQRLTVQQYIDHAREEVRRHAADEAALRALWLDPAKRAELLAALLAASVAPEAIAALRAYTDADTYDLLAAVAFGREPHSRGERVDAFLNRNADFVNSFPPQARGVLLARLDKYRLGGVDELEQAEAFRAPPFDAMGFAPGVVQRFGDAQRLRAAIQGFTRRLYEA